MLVQDQMTGYVSEVPDHLYGYDGYAGYGEYPDHMGESQMLYDGLGNPVGLFPAIAAALPAMLPAATSFASKIPFFGKLFGGGRPPGAPGGPPGFPGLPPGFPFSPMPGGPMPFRPPWPAGWSRPQLPYTGLGPRRLYMRCAVWPGPKGLVPAHAAAAQGALPAVMTSPAAAAAQSVAQAAQAAAMGGRRRRRRRR